MKIRLRSRRRGTVKNWLIRHTRLPAPCARRLVGLLARGVGRVKPECRGALPHPFDHEGLELVLLGRLLGNLLVDASRDDHNTFAVPDTDVAGKDRHAPA